MRRLSARPPLLLALATLAVACSDGPRLPALLEVPHPALENADSGVLDHVRRSREALERLLAADPPEPRATARAFADLGRAYLVYDFPEAAEVCLANAATVAPEDPRWQYLLGYVVAFQGRLEEGVPLYERSLELEPGFVPALVRLGRIHLEMGQPGPARARFEQALSLDAEAAAALEGLGKVAAAEGDPAAAEGYFRRALALAPQATSLHYALGQAYRDQGRFEEARRELELSGDVAVPVTDPLISPLAVLGESVQFYLVQGGEALGNRQFETAVAAYERALAQDDGSFLAYRGLAYSLEKLGDLNGAVAVLETGLVKGSTGRPDKDPGERAELHRILGGLEVLRARDRAAVGHFSSSLKLAPEQPGTAMKLANALSRLGRFEEALPLYGRLIESRPDVAPDILARRATALINLGRGDEALADFRRALKLRSGDARLRLRYAEALDHLGLAGPAAEQRRLASAGLAADDQRAAVLLQTAQDRMARGRYDEALESLTACLGLQPDRHDVRAQRASVLGHLGRYGEAVAEFRRVVEAEPRHPTARHGEITGLVLLGRYGEARMRLNEALRVFSLDARLAHLQARLLATVPDRRVRDGRIALEVARRLQQAVGGVRVQETLAMAHAELGQFDRAAELQRELVAAAEQQGNAELSADLRAKLESFEGGRAWWASGPEEILDAALAGG